MHCSHFCHLIMKCPERNEVSEAFYALSSLKVHLANMCLFTESTSYWRFRIALNKTDIQQKIFNAPNIFRGKQGWGEAFGVLGNVKG